MHWVTNKTYELDIRDIYIYIPHKQDNKAAKSKSMKNTKKKKTGKQ